MDYKEKYNNILEKARILKYANPSDEGIQKWVEDTFPELKESEDERIRKELIDAVQGYALPMPLSVKRKDAWIAWLEKQHTDPYNGVGFDCYGHHWSMCARDNGVELWIDNKLVQHFGADIHFFEGKSALEAINEVKVDNSISVNNTPYDYEHVTIAQKDFAPKEELKKLEEKPAEWSEEDETGLTNTIIMLKEGASLHFIKKDIAKAVDWLKSLKERIGWKPSKEHMKALHDLNLTGKISYAGQGQVLIELYNDLKKLK